MSAILYMYIMWNIPEMNDAKWPSEQKNELILFGLHF